MIVGAPWSNTRLDLITAYREVVYMRRADLTAVTGQPLDVRPMEPDPKKFWWVSSNGGIHMSEKELQLRQMVEDIIERCRAGVSMEDPKLDLKRQWSRLRGVTPEEQRKNESEFLKDLVAMVNTPGPTGYLVYGLDDHGNVYDAPLATSGLTDPTALRGIVVKRVDKPVNFEVYPVRLTLEAGVVDITVLEVPPSNEKPHVISLYTAPRGDERQNFVPIRKNTGIFPAAKWDFDHMVYDNKNVEPDYALTLLQHNHRAVFNADSNRIVATLTLALQNFGAKPVGVVSGGLHMEPGYLEGLDPDLGFSLVRYNEDLDATGRNFWTQNRCLVIPSNTIKPVQLHFESTKEYRGDDLNGILGTLRGLAEFHFRVTLQALDQYSTASDRFIAKK